MKNSKAKRDATIRDVAGAAGVSIATVSKFVNKLQHFSPEVEQKLREAIETLGYRQNPAARSMVTGKTRAIGLAVIDIGNPHFANIVKGANRAALSHNYDLLIVDLAEHLANEKHLLEILSRRVDGIMVSSRISDEHIDWLNSIGKPVVFLGQVKRKDVTNVRSDGYNAAVILGRYLADSGVKEIVYLSNFSARWNKDRIHGFEDVSRERGISLEIYDVPSSTLESGQSAAVTILQNAKKLEVVIGCNDLVAFGFMHEALDRGFKIPDDFMIAGFDNIPIGRFSNPPLTSVAMQSDMLGERAFHKIITLIEQPNEESEEIVLEPLLFPRRSTQATDK